MFSSICLNGLAAPLPGKGKWLRCGSSVVMLLWNSSKLTGARKSPKSSESFCSSSLASDCCCGIIDVKLNLDTLLMEKLSARDSWEVAEEAASLVLRSETIEWLIDLEGKVSARRLKMGVALATYLFPMEISNGRGPIGAFPFGNTDCLRLLVKLDL